MNFRLQGINLRMQQVFSKKLIYVFIAHSFEYFSGLLQTYNLRFLDRVRYHM